MLNDTNSQKTHGNGSLSTRTKEEEDDFDLSFEDDIFLDLQKGDFLLDEWAPRVDNTSVYHS